MSVEGLSGRPVLFLLENSGMPISIEIPEGIAGETTARRLLIPVLHREIGRYLSVFPGFGQTRTRAETPRSHSGADTVQTAQ